MNPPAQLCEQSQRQKDAYRTYYTNPFRLYICSVCTKLFSINSNFSFNQRRNIYIFYLDWPEGIVSIPVGQPDPTRPISLTLTQTPLPQLTIVPCGLILCASLVRFCLNARSSSSRLANPTQRPTRPNPTNIANANPNPPTPADRVVPALGHSTVWADFVSVSGSILSQRSCCRVCALCGSEFKIMGLYNRFCNRFFCRCDCSHNCAGRFTGAATARRVSTRANRETVQDSWGAFEGNSGLWMDRCGSRAVFTAHQGLHRHRPQCNIFPFLYNVTLERELS